MADQGRIQMGVDCVEQAKDHGFEEAAPASAVDIEEKDFKP